MKQFKFLIAAMCSLLIFAACEKKEEVKKGFNLTNASWICYNGKHTTLITDTPYYSWYVVTFKEDGHYLEYIVSTDTSDESTVPNGEVGSIDYYTYSCNYPKLIFHDLGGDHEYYFTSETQFKRDGNGWGDRIHNKANYIFKARNVSTYAIGTENLKYE